MAEIKTGTKRAETETDRDVQAGDRRGGGAGYELLRIAPGSRHDTVPADRAFLDIYLDGATAEYVSENGERERHACAPNSFNYLPPGHRRDIQRARTGVAVQLSFEPHVAHAISPAMAECLVNAGPKWQAFDQALIGIATMVAEHMIRLEADQPLTDADRSMYARMLITRTAQILSTAYRNQPAERPIAIQRAIEFIENHYMEPIQLADVASEAGLSPYHFSRLFRQTMQSNLRAYLTLRRISVAKEMLQQSDVAIATIAYQVGFGSQSHMTTQFKRFTGRTPGEWRKSTVLIR